MCFYRRKVKIYFLDCCKLNYSLKMNGKIFKLQIKRLPKAVLTVQIFSRSLNIPLEDGWKYLPISKCARNEYFLPTSTTSKSDHSSTVSRGWNRPPLRMRLKHHPSPADFSKSVLPEPAMAAGNVRLVELRLDRRWRVRLEWRRKWGRKRPKIFLTFHCSSWTWYF